MTYPLKGSSVCDPKKYAECFYLHTALALLSKRFQSFICGESPDFSIGFDSGKVGVEVTYYHSLAEGANGRCRRALEEEWELLQREIMSEVDRVPELNGVTGRLDFYALDLPERRHHGAFGQELVKLSLQMIASQMLKAKPGKEFPLLNRYVEKLTLRRVDCYLRWEWDHNAAFIGLSEEELINTIEPKIGKAPKYAEKGDLDELWLLVVSEHRLSQTMPPRLLDKLNSFKVLNGKLAESQYSRVFVYQYLLDVIYEWPGWKKLGEEKFISSIDDLNSCDG